MPTCTGPHSIHTLKVKEGLNFCVDGTLQRVLSQKKHDVVNSEHGMGPTLTKGGRSRWEDHEIVGKKPIILGSFYPFYVFDFCFTL